MKVPSFPLRALVTTVILGTSGGLLVPKASAQIQFQPPPMTSPGNRESGGNRSDTCASTTEGTGLTVIVPDTNVGLTTQSSPALFIYIPSNNAVRAELRLMDEASGEEVFLGEINLSPISNPKASYRYQPSIVKVSLPSSQRLEAGRNYLWAVMLVCDEANRADDIVSTAVVQRVNDTYLQALSSSVRTDLASAASASSQERLAVYSAAGIWQDLLAELSTLAKTSPSTYSSQWQDLLTAQGLGAIANAPLYETTVTPLLPQ